MNLNHKDIQAIVRTLDDSPYDELQLENAEFSLYLKRTAAGWTQQQQTLQAATPLHLTTAAGAVPAALLPVSEAAPTEAGLVDIRSPMVGTFYRAPQPGTAPYVEIGAPVASNTIIAIIEVMKLMCSIPALTAGTVHEILVQDAQLVEKGQLLMRVKPGPV
ncbi:MAG: acetyl-CoA carboxylase biotin carboxyl carrier protein [Gammaproteobacteria bacterium]|jgi:acetyl-CoA carboxylase biotin carboxyl carrier protein